MKFFTSTCSFLLLAFTCTDAVTLRGNGSSSLVDTSVIASSPADQSSRNLVEWIDGMRDFVTLSNTCNQGIESATCRSWAAEFGVTSVHNTRITVPCGYCFIMDHAGETLTFNKGLDIHGKLVFPNQNGYKLEVIATVIAVQGMLKIESTKQVTGVEAYKFTMIGNDDNEFTPIDVNAKNCKGEVTCGTGKKAIVVAGGHIDINGLPANTPSWVRLQDVAGGTFDAPKSIIVDASVKGKWAPGAEILITSHTIVWDAHQERTIEKVIDLPSKPGFVMLELNSPIIRPTTMVESKDFAVEVALLSRNVVFEGGPDSKPFHGGHFWVMHTPLVQQSIVGKSIVNNFLLQTNMIGSHLAHCISVS